MPKVIIPTPLRQYAGKQEALDLEAKTVGELLTRLVAEHGDLKRHLYTDDGKLRSFVNVYLNDEDIRYLQKEDTPVKDSDVVSIVPSIAGGKEKDLEPRTCGERSRTMNMDEHGLKGPGPVARVDRRPTRGLSSLGRAGACHLPSVGARS